jgi:hypothetical protein
MKEILIPIDFPADLDAGGADLPLIGGRPWLAAVLE